MSAEESSEVIEPMVFWEDCSGADPEKDTNEYLLPTQEWVLEGNSAKEEERKDDALSSDSDQNDSTAGAKELPIRTPQRTPAAPKPELEEGEDESSQQPNDSHESDVYMNGNQKSKTETRSANSKPLNQMRYFLSNTKGVVCFKCNQEGHIARDCTNAKEIIRCRYCGNTGHQNDTCPKLLCWNCKKTGHLAKECPADRPESDPNEEDSRAKSFVANKKPKIDPVIEDKAERNQARQDDEKVEGTGNSEDKTAIDVVSDTKSTTGDYYAYGAEPQEPKHRWKTLFDPVDTTTLTNLVPKKMLASEFYSRKQLTRSGSNAGASSDTQLPPIDAADTKCSDLDVSRIPFLRFRPDELEPFVVDEKTSNTWCFNCSKEGHIGWTCRHSNMEQILLSRKACKTYFRERQELLEARNARHRKSTQGLKSKSSKQKKANRTPKD